jgi:sRNA-binding regulator protein Hfq
MERQHTENLFRRYRGKRVSVRTISGSIYNGQVGEITNDYVLLTEGETQTFVVYEAIESIVVIEPAS